MLVGAQVVPAELPQVLVHFVASSQALTRVYVAHASSTSPSYAMYPSQRLYATGRRLVPVVAEVEANSARYEVLSKGEVALDPRAFVDVFCPGVPDMNLKSSRRRPPLSGESCSARKIMHAWTDDCSIQKIAEPSEPAG